MYWKLLKIVLKLSIVVRKDVHELPKQLSLKTVANYSCRPSLKVSLHPHNFVKFSSDISDFRTGIPTQVNIRFVCFFRLDQVGSSFLFLFYPFVSFPPSDVPLKVEFFLLYSRICDVVML